MGWELGFAFRVVFGFFWWIIRLIWYAIFFMFNRSQAKPPQFDAFGDKNQKKR